MQLQQQKFFSFMHLLLFYLLINKIKSSQSWCLNVRNQRKLHKPILNFTYFLRKLKHWKIELASTLLP